jgi:hypothetical protein
MRGTAAAPQFVRGAAAAQIKQLLDAAPVDAFVGNQGDDFEKFRNAVNPRRIIAVMGGDCIASRAVHVAG